MSLDIAVLLSLHLLRMLSAFGLLLECLFAIRTATASRPRFSLLYSYRKVLKFSAYITVPV